MTRLPSVLLCLLLFVAPSSAETSPDEVVDAFHAALRTGDGETALSLLAKDVVIFEGGSAEMTRAEYGSHHLEADMAFSAATEREVTEKLVRLRGESAIVLSRTVTKGTFRDHTINHEGSETMVLVGGVEGWKISHIHWSSRKRPE